MMADAKFKEAEVAAFELLTTTSNKEVIPLYLELLTIQNRPLPFHLLIQAAEEEIEWLNKISASELEKNFAQISFTKLRYAENKGLVDLIYSTISDFQINQFKNQKPNIPQLVLDLTNKYFKNDFHLKLQKLAIELRTYDYANCEKGLIELILSCHEKNLKAIREKYQAIYLVLKIDKEKSVLDIYSSYLQLCLTGINQKTDNKKLAELVIYFDDFKMQVLILQLFDDLSLNEITKDYAKIVFQNKNYDFVYLDKYFKKLKTYFFEKKNAPEETESKALLSSADLKLENRKTEQELENFDYLLEEEEISGFKFLDYSFVEFCELAISFIQAEMPKTALEAAKSALLKAADDKSYLKACYLKLICLLELKDYRSALDTTLEALKMAKETDDILSFLYSQAEVYLKLNEKRNAKRILQQIISIDSKYRLTRERLEKLDEV